MICPACRNRRHGECAEMIRQDREDLTVTELAGSAWCDCDCGHAGPRAKVPQEK